MSTAPNIMHLAVVDDVHDATHAIGQLEASLRARLHAAGVLLPDDVFDRLAEDVLADAIQVAVGWLER